MAAPSAAQTDIDLLTAGQLAQQLRVDSIRCSTAAGSGPVSMAKLTPALPA